MPKSHLSTSGLQAASLQPEIKLAGAGGIPVAISTTLPPAVARLSQQQGIYRHLTVYIFLCSSYIFFPPLCICISGPVLESVKTWTLITAGYFVKTEEG